MKAIRGGFRIDGLLLKVKSKISIALVISLVVTSCATKDTKKAHVGAATGAVIGGAVGAAIGKKNRLLGALIGIAIGAGAGYLIGRELDKKDQAALKEKVEEVAEKGRTDEPVSWESDHSGASAKITPLEEPKTVEVTKNISKAPEVMVSSLPLKMATGSRVATTDVNIRFGPSTKYAVKDVLRRRQEVAVVGVTEDGWYLIEREGRAIGYVSGRYLKKPGETRASIARNVPAPIETRPKQPRQSDEREQSQAKQTEEEEVRVTIVGTCRPVRVRVKNADGKIEEQTVNTCKGPDGSWGA